MLAEGVLRSATILHASILKSGLRAPMSFFDSTPIGRIINRFSKDIDVVDNQLPRTLHQWIVCALSILETVVVISCSTPMFLVVVLPMSVFYYLVQVHHPVPLLPLRCPHHFQLCLILVFIFVLNFFPAWCIIYKHAFICLCTWHHYAFFLFYLLPGLSIYSFQNRPVPFPGRRS